MSEMAFKMKSTIARRAFRLPAELSARSLRRAALLPLLLGAPILSMAETVPAPPQVARPIIRLEQIVAALKMAMLPLEDAVVRLLAQNTAAIADPGLEVKAIEAWGDRGARIRMGCAAHAQCLPFYVAVDWPNDAAAKAALHAAGRIAADSTHDAPSLRRPMTSPQSAATSAETGKPAAVGSAVSNSAEDRVQAATETFMQAGSHATLLIDGQRLHIKLPVICLERGSVGRTIRVTALDHKQTYRAEVIDSTLLRGSL